MLAAALNLVGLLQALHLVVSNQFKLDGFSVFSFSKLIYLRKRYKLSSVGNKFLSCLILLFVNAESSLVNVNHPRFCFTRLPRSLTNFLLTSAWTLLMASLLHCLGEQLGRADPLPAHWNKCIYSSLPWPFPLLQVSLIWCWKQFNLVQFEDHLQQLCLLIPASFFKSCFCLYFPGVAPGHIFHT